LFLNSGKYDPGCSSRIRILIFITHPGSRIQRPKIHRIPDPVSLSATLLNWYPAHLEDDDQERGERFDDAELESALFTESGKKNIWIWNFVKVKEGSTV
jgi:hypothetical protein